jgi:cysteine-rich repeat protein
LLPTRITMSRIIRSGICAIAAAWLGCAGPTDDGLAQGPGGPEAEGRLRLVFRFNDGTLAPGAVFPRKEDVHQWTRLAEGSTSFTDGDLAFVVLDMYGRQVSTDALDCRRFRVAGGRGRTVEVLAGVDADGSPCQHDFGYHDDGAVMPQLFPFADVDPNVSGVMEYELRVARVEEIVGGEFPADAFRGTFYVLPPKPPCCGDGRVDAGEQCDDGNTAGGDGCSSDCKLEPPAPPHCGDGHVDPGEACDDGNTTDGDGCSATCTLEIGP